MLHGKNSRIQKNASDWKVGVWLAQADDFRTLSENLCQACHTAAPLSENIEACGLCQFSLAVVKLQNRFILSADEDLPRTVAK
jgi:hypothetical protein